MTTFVSQKLADLKKNVFALDPDKYLDQSIQNALSATKMGFENRPFKEALQYKVLCIDEVESIALALEVVKRGKYKEKDTEEEKPYAYQQGLDAYLAANPKPTDNQEDALLQWQVRFANFKMRLILNALHRHSASTIEFTF